MTEYESCFNMAFFNVIIDRMEPFLATLFRYSLAILPWVLVGMCLAFFLEKKINRKAIRDHFSRVSIRGLFVVQILGMISPLSIMSFLPMASELEGMGFNPGILLSFLIAERAYDLQSFFIVSGLFGIRYALLNGLAIFLTLLVTGLFLRKTLVRFTAVHKLFHHGFWQRQGRLFVLVVLGIVAGAIVRTVIPEGQFHAYTGGNTGGFLVALLTGFLFYFGPIVGNYPVAKAFAELGMSPMGTFAFLTVSPILNLVVIMLFGASVGWRNTLKAFFVYAVTASIVTVLLSFLL